MAFDGIVNRHNCRIWGSQLSQEINKHQRDSTKVNMRFGMMEDHIIGPLFFQEATITSHCTWTWKNITQYYNCIVMHGSSKMESPTFWKQCSLAFKPMFSKQVEVS
jgi:hypothetical protein